MDKLEEYRVHIDTLDKEIVELLAKRFDVVSAILHYKADNNLGAVQPARAQMVIDDGEARSAAKGLPEGLGRDVFQAIIDHSHIMQKEILGDNE